MASEDTANGEQIIIDKPERGAKEGYLVSFFNSSQQMNRVIAESNGISDHRIRLLTLKMIASITDDDKREKTFQYFAQELKKIEEMKDKDNNRLSADEKNQKIADFCCGEMQGHITSWYDEFLGITHKLRLGDI